MWKLTPVIRRLLLTFALISLAGCVQTPLTKTVAEAMGWGTSVDELNLNPDYRYLRVSTPERAFLMVLGYVDTSPDGDVQTWYGKEGQVLRLRQGRILSSKGFPVDWTTVTYKDLPDWTTATSRPRVRFVRYRDEMPGYKVGVFNIVTLRRIEPPTDARLSGIPPSSLLWVEETTDISPRGRPSARYGLKMIGERYGVVYGEQCLSTQFCMAWQTWPATP